MENFKCYKLDSNSPVVVDVAFSEKGQALIQRLKNRAQLYSGEGLDNRSLRRISNHYGSTLSEYGIYITKASKIALKNMEEGMAQGKLEEKLNIAKELIKLGILKNTEIATITGLPEGEIESLR